MVSLQMVLLPRDDTTLSIISHLTYNKHEKEKDRQQPKRALGEHPKK